MKLKPEFRKGSFNAKNLPFPINLAVATDAELKTIYDAGHTHIFEPEIIQPEKIEEVIEYKPKKKNKK